jgi:hypothetical protein
MSTRIQDRLQRGIGAGYSENQKLSGGYTPEEADRQARIARGEEIDADPLTPVEESKEEEKKEIPNPSVQPATEEEVKTASRIAAMVGNAGSKLKDLDPILEDNKQLRSKIEASLEPIDVTRLLWDDFAEQEVPLFAGKIKLVLRTIPTTLVTLVDRWIFEIVGHTMTSTTKMKLRLFLLYALTVQRIDNEIPGDSNIPNELPNAFSRDWKSIGTLFEKRLQWILQKNPAIVDLIMVNITWFEQRVRRTVSDAQFVGQEIKKS